MPLPLLTAGSFVSNNLLGLIVGPAVAKMSTRALVAAGGLLIAGLVPALSDRITARVVEWNPVTRSITFDDMSRLADLPNNAATR